jgi:hypothetical protein
MPRNLMRRLETPDLLPHANLFLADASGGRAAEPSIRLTVRKNPTKIGPSECNEIGPSDDP